jgi:hypothetical protein
MRKMIAVVLIALICACHSAPKADIQETSVPVLWANMTLFVTRNTPSNSPTFASRALGYIGLSMYESIVPGYPAYASVASQLNQLKPLPSPEKGKEYSWILSLNAAEASIIKSIYIQTSPENLDRVDSLEKVIYESFKDKLHNDEMAERSVKYGRSVAQAIFEWSKTDGGHRGYLTNFDKKMTYSNKPGSWKPPFFAQTISRLPLHPHWGNNRTFLSTDSNWKMPAFIGHDTSYISACYKQFLKVYEANKKITQEQKEIALWWNDDPSQTYTPPGHSYNLASITVKAEKSDLIKSAETYARVGIAVADAFIVCWRIKYNFFSERPSAYVSENVDSDWDPFWPDPPFPAFPSGHATQAAAVATTLAGLYGDSVNIIDDTHIGRPRDEAKNVDYKVRKFSSFWQVAQETAYSRFLGGIHTFQDNVVGLEEGSKIGNHINALKWN